jgi:ribosomal protein S19
MSRSKWKGPYIDKKNELTLEKLTESYTKIKMSRNTTIFPNFVGKTLKIHNGKTFGEVLVTEEMIGHKFGEFSSTRKRFSFRKTKAKK